MKLPASGNARHGGRRPAEASSHPEGPVDVRDRQECEACGTEMYGLHCKIVCPNCGYKRDCSDP